MGLGSYLGFDSAKTSNNGFDKWRKQGRIGFERSLSSITYSKRKKIKDFMKGEFNGGKKLSHDQILRKISAKFGYDTKKSVQKALTPKQRTDLTEKPKVSPGRIQKDYSALKEDSKYKKTEQASLGAVSGKGGNIFAGSGQRQQAGQKNKPTEISQPSKFIGINTKE